jgi:pimeloyl-ACP methyl ester carboxylesterase
VSIEPTRRTVATASGDVSIAEVGEGPVFVMLHGGGPGASGEANFHQNLPALSKLFRVVLPDQPGFGWSYRPTQEQLDEHSITQIAVDALIEAFDQLGIDKFHLLGNSLGGAAAIALAQQHPARVDKLILMAPGGGWLPFGPTPTEGQKEMVETAEARYEASLEESHMEFYHRLNDHFAKRRGMDPLWQQLHKIKAPTLLLWGRDDRTITLEGAQIMLKYIRDVQLHVYGKCGHWVQLERQAEFERLVTDFLGGSS